MSVADSLSVAMSSEISKEWLAKRRGYVDTGLWKKVGQPS
jgi:hypothetical protein